MPVDGTPRVSLIIPVYNAGPYLRECLDSALAQKLPAEDLEIVAVDDGSTDGSGAVLDDYATRHANLRVIHQENSGWPGRPRNVGLDASRGAYVFFLDADDRLDTGALRRLVKFAERHSSDIVVPKIVGLDGRAVRDEPFLATRVSADLAPLFGSLVAMKLFRRAFLDEHGLRFPEGKVRFEDGRMVIPAYLRARRVSVLADRDYYFLRQREDGGNLSYSLGHPREYLQAVGELIDLMRAEGADDRVRHSAAADLLARKALRHLGPERIDEHAPWRLRAWFAATREFAERHVPVEAQAALPVALRLRSRVVRDGRLPALRALVEMERKGVTPRAQIRRGRIFVEIRRRFDVTEDLALDVALESLRHRRGRADVSGHLRVEGVRLRAPQPLTIAVGRVETRVLAHGLPGGEWFYFDARVPAAPEAGAFEPVRLWLGRTRGWPRATIGGVAAPPAPATARARLKRVARKPRVAAVQRSLRGKR